MKKIDDFKFTLNVSNEGYEQKTDATCCLSEKGALAINRKKMCFFEETLSVDEFIDKAEKGHSFCALYRFEQGKKYFYTTKEGKKYLGYPYYQRDSKTATKGGLKIDFKRDEYFSGSQVIFIDIDYTKYTDIEEYINKLTFKPTCIYMSYSDGKDKKGIVSRRFHLVYIFDTILDKDTIKFCSSTLSEALVVDTGEELEDKCGEKISQYMNGCFGNQENYKSYIIYSLDDIKNFNIESSIKEDDVKEEKEEDKITTINSVLQKEETVVEDETKPESLFDEKLLNDWDRLDIEEFKRLRDWENYRRTTKHYYRVDNEEWINDKIQKVDENFFSLFWIKSTVHDGSKRRKGLYERMCLRRLINPEITPMELAVNTIIDIIRFYDNSDGVLNSDFIKRNVLNCLELTIEEIEDKYKGTLEYLRNTTKPKRGFIYKDKESHSKETTYEILDDYYNRDVDVKENLKFINEVCKFPISLRTLYNYLKDRGIKNDSLKLTDEEVEEFLDLSISAFENYKNLKEEGYKISKDRVNKIYKNKKKNNIIVEEVIGTTINSKLQNKEMKVEVKINLNFNDYLNAVLNNYPIDTNFYNSNSLSGTIGNPYY